VGTVNVPLAPNISVFKVAPPPGVAQVESPRKNVDELAVPEASRAVPTVPLEIFAAFKLVTFEPVPLNAIFMLH
jgi:hypothetical protein